MFNTFVIIRISLALCVVTICCVACTQAGDDPIARGLESATKKYDLALKSVNENAFEWFDDQLKDAVKKGDADAKESIELARAQFAEDGVLPKEAPLAIKQKAWNAHGAMERALKEASVKYTKKKNDQAAASVEERIDALRDKFDRLPMGSDWKGTIEFFDHMGKRVYQGPVNAKVTERDSHSFTLHTQHSDVREWDFEFSENDKGYFCTKANLVKVQNAFGDQPGERAVAKSGVAFKGELLVVTVSRVENDKVVTLVYAVQQE